MKKHVQEEDTKTTPEPTAQDIGQNYRNRRNGTSRICDTDWNKSKEDLKHRESDVT